MYIDLQHITTGGGGGRRPGPTTYLKKMYHFLNIMYLLYKNIRTTQLLPCQFVKPLPFFVKPLPFFWQAPPFFLTSPSPLKTRLSAWTLFIFLLYLGLGLVVSWCYLLLQALCTEPKTRRNWRCSLTTSTCQFLMTTMCRDVTRSGLPSSYLSHLFLIKLRFG